ncbi:MAG: hypothetical protein LBB20_01870 [Puniceicoccales bacterium]|nr:hypothetical protein [Puniceicoccales bacterium]
MDSLENLEKKILPVLYNALKDMSNLKVDLPRSCLLATEIDGLDSKSSPESLIRKLEAARSTLICNDIRINFVHEDGTSEPVGKLVPKIMLSKTRDHGIKPQDVVVITVDATFNKGFNDLDALTSGFAGILKAYVDNFRAKNDSDYSVYFELCDEFFVSKLAIKLGFLPGWLDHVMASGKQYQQLKNHSLFLIDRFLDFDNYGTLPIDTLVSFDCKVQKQNICPGIVPRNWPENAVTMVFYYPIWNRNVDIEHIYRMEGPFWNKNAPDNTKILLDEFSQKYIERISDQSNILKILEQR